MLRLLNSTRIGLLPSRSIASYDTKNYKAVNEPLLDYTKDSPERKKLEETVKEYLKETKDIPIIIGDEEIRYKDEVSYQILPFDHKKKIAKFYNAKPKDITKSIESNLKARAKWENTPWEERAKVFLKTADLMSGKYRSHMVATTMLGQGKTIYQAEIDAAAELIDFLRFNVENMANLSKYKPISTDQAKNELQYRGMEGFWASITPFNFTAIGGNLAATPAFAGNVVLWKPTESALLSNHLFYTILREAGLPPGVVNFVPSTGRVLGGVISKHPELTGVNFTGSVPTFQHLFKAIGENIHNLNHFPRLIGECGGKNFHLIHESADIDGAVNSTIRSAFEYSGQKCSACSRLYVPDSIWDKFIGKLVSETKKLKFDSPLKYDSTYASALIDKKAFDRLKEAIDVTAKGDKKNTILAGGTYDDSVGYFIHPTIVETKDPNHELMLNEYFGPLLTVYRYKASDPIEDTMKLVDKTSGFALTGAIFAQDEKFIKLAKEKMKFASGNFYINCQSTGAVVGQQPFGGARLSGTNDKAGGPHYLLRFLSPRAVKTQLQPVTTYHVPHVTVR